MQREVMELDFPKRTRFERFFSEQYFISEVPSYPCRCSSSARSHGSLLTFPHDCPDSIQHSSIIPFDACGFALIPSDSLCWSAPASSTCAPTGCSGRPIAYVEGVNHGVA